MNDKISIILPIFNVGPHLRGGIDSLINQTIGNENLEIIMVNDCSTDGSDKIIDEYAEKYDCCVAIHHETNSGGAHTPRNTGIEASTGDYIMFLDPDDRYTPDACEVLYNTIKENDVDLAFARFRRIFEYGGYVQKSYSPYEDDLESAYPDEKSPDTFDPENAYSFFEYVYCNRDVRRMLISTSKLNVSYEAFARVYGVRSRADYHSIFYGIGLWAVVDAWERRGYQESIEDMVRIIQDASIR